MIYTEIDKSLWKTCRLCNTKIKGGDGKYFSQQFLKHMKECHDISPEEYMVREGLSRPLCACGECNQPVTIGYHGSKLKWNTYVCGNNEGVKKWSKQAKETRKGANNPMYGKKAWNMGLTKDSHESVKAVSRKLTGRTISPETKLKQSESAKKRTIHGHTGHKHSEKTKEVLRQHTLRRIAEGKFPQTDTLPCRLVEQVLKDLQIQYIKEHIVEMWSFDFYLPEHDLLVEVDGDYFHSNPRSYPDGPKTKTQKLNSYRDYKKNEYCTKHNMNLIRIWEYDIINTKDNVIQRIKKCMEKK